MPLLIIPPLRPSGAVHQAVHCRLRPSPCRRRNCQRCQHYDHGRLPSRVVAMGCTGPKRTASHHSA
jgi:hypothetical protein